MRVLVTGGAGYIGSVIVEELTKAGHTPVVYDSFVKGHPRALPEGTILVRGSTADMAALTQAMSDHQIDAVIHMAALIEVGLSVSNPARFFEFNVGGSINVVRAMLDTGVRKLVFSSTAALYGDPEHLPIQEDDPPQPTNPYGASKLMVEQMLEWVAPAQNLSCVALRYFNAAGATERNGEDHDPETHLIPLTLKAASEGKPATIFGTDYPTPDGTTVRDYVHVVDLAQAHLLALGREEPGLRIYNVGYGNGYSVREVIETVGAIAGKPLQVIEQPRRPGDQAATIAASDRIRAELGWQPRYNDLRVILESAWKWRQAHPNGYEE